MDCSTQGGKHSSKPYRLFWSPRETRAGALEREVKASEKKRVLERVLKGGTVHGRWKRGGQGHDTWKHPVTLA